jgi:hypothetical protein
MVPGLEIAAGLVAMAALMASSFVAGICWHVSNDKWDNPLS